MAGWLNFDDSNGLTIAANRDEFVDRQGEIPQLHSEGSLEVLSPRDPRAGGTWIGLNEDGLFVALTNKLDANYREDAPSRGQLVRTLLEESADREAADGRYEQLDPDRYNPFWLLVADPSGLTVHRHEHDGDERFTHTAGQFFLSNQSGFHSNSDAIEEVLPDLEEKPLEKRNTILEQFCASHEPLLERDAHCLHADIAGTLSSSIIQLNPREGLSYRFSQGPPCENDYRSIPVTESFRTTALEAWSSRHSETKK